MCTLSATWNFLESQALGLDSEPLFRRLLKLRLAMADGWSALNSVGAIGLRRKEVRGSQDRQGFEQTNIGGGDNLIELRRDYDVLNWYRLIPNFLIFDSSVCRGMPSLVAAPVGPEMSPSASRSAVSIISLSWSIRFATSGTLEAAVFRVTGVSQVSSTQKVSPSLRITARSITFCNSRTLPGQS